MYWSHELCMHLMNLDNFFYNLQVTSLGPTFPCFSSWINKRYSGIPWMCWTLSGSCLRLFFCIIVNNRSGVWFSLSFVLFIVFVEFYCIFLGCAHWTHTVSKGADDKKRDYQGRTECRFPQTKRWRCLSSNAWRGLSLINHSYWLYASLPRLCYLSELFFLYITY